MCAYTADTQTFFTRFTGIAYQGRGMLNVAVIDTLAIFMFGVRSLSEYFGSRVLDRPCLSSNVCRITLHQGGFNWQRVLRNDAENLDL